MLFDLVIFDLDGTLIDTRFDMTTAINEVLSSYGLPEKGVEEVTGYVGDGIRVLVERCVVGSGIDITEAVSRFKDSYWNHMLDRTEPYPGVTALLDRIGGIKKAVLTNKAYSFTKAIMDRLGLTERFECIVGGDSVGRKKPYTDGVRYILQKTGVTAARAIMVGDGKNDIVVAKKTGLVSVWAGYGFCGRERLAGEKPNFEIMEPSGLIDILESGVIKG
ncbi:MAG: HAD-IA family hydrolase [Spirochaetes bacterium]|nr:HAD-IA family hydrolase [Spirochaetota bacterium]